MSDDGAILLAVLVVLLLVYGLPLIWVLVSDRSHGGAKLGWLIVILAFSWVGFAAFLILTQASKDRRAE